jgi:hypothetical protein
MAATQLASPPRTPLLKLLIATAGILVCFALLTYIVYTYLPVNLDWHAEGPPSIGVDWKIAYRPAAIEVLHGRTPYTVPRFVNPPWVLLPLLPIAFLSPPLGSAFMYVLNLFAFLFVMMRLRLNYWLIIPLLALSGMMVNQENGNIEGLLALGFILPPSIGMFFVLAKPQIGIAVALYWTVKAWRLGGPRQTVKILFPVAVGFLLTFLIFPDWLHGAIWHAGASWNASLWPFGIPLGLVLVGLSLWKRQVKLAIAASPFFAPYLASYSWGIVWLGLVLLVPQHIHLPFGRGRPSKEPAAGDHI